MYKTGFAGLTVLEPGESLQADGSSFTGRNPVVTDHYLQIGARTHRHDAHEPLSDPEDQPVVELSVEPGSLPSDTTVGIAYTLIDTDGGETMAAPVGSVTTPSPMESPYDEPDIEILDSGGSLMAGLYYYVLTLTDGAGGETTPGPTIVVEVPSGSDYNKIVFTGLGDIVTSTPDADGWRMYKSTESSQMHFLASGEAILDTITDDGNLCLDCTEIPPRDNTTHQDNAITVTIPDTVTNNQDRCMAYRVYLGLDGDFTSPALLEQRTLDTLGVPKDYTNTLTDIGTPPDVSTSIAGASQIDPDTDILDWVWRRPVPTFSALPEGIQGDVRLTLDDGRLWVVLGVDGALTPSQWSQIKGGTVAGTDEVQKVTVTSATGGTFTLLRGVAATSAIAYNALAADVMSRLESLPTIGPGNVLVTGPAGGPYIINYVGARAGTDQPELTANASSLVGAGHAVTVETLVQGGQSGHAIWDEGVALPARNVIDFVGEAITVTDDPTSGRTIVTVTATGGGGGGPAGFAGAEHLSSTDVTIPDGGSPVETAALNVPESAIIGTDTDFPELQLYIQHTAPGDLRVDLIHPDNTVYNVTYEESPDPNIGNDFTPTGRAVFTPLTERAWPDTSGADAVNGRFRPMGDWSSMIGKDIEGDWKLRLHDPWSGDSGALRDWGLVFTAGATEMPGDQQLLLPDTIDWYEGSQYGQRRGRLFLRPKSEAIFSGTDILNPFGFPGSDIVNELNANTLSYSSGHLVPTSTAEKRFTFKSSDDRWWMDDFRWVFRFDILSAGWGEVSFGIQDQDGNLIYARNSEAHTTMQIRRLIEEDDGVESNPSTASFGTTPGVGTHWVAIERCSNRILFEEYRTDPATNPPYRQVEYVPATDDRHWDVGLSLGYRPWFKFVPASTTAVTYFKSPDQLKPIWARHTLDDYEPWFKSFDADNYMERASRLVPERHPLLTNERQQIVWHASQYGGTSYIYARDGRAYLTGRVSVSGWANTQMLAKALPRCFRPLEDTYIAAPYGWAESMSAEKRVAESWRITTAGTILRQQPPDADGMAVCCDGMSWLIHPNYTPSVAEFVNNATGAPGELINEAISAMQYPWERANIKVTFVTVDEPSCAGHTEFACTHRTSRDDLSGEMEYTVEFRTGFGNPSPPPFTPEFSGRKFVLETVAHELGHVIADYNFGWQEDPQYVEVMTGMFTREDPSSGNVTVGVASKWASGDWQEHIEEAVAETFKDIFLPKALRAFDNRTMWMLKRTEFIHYLTLMGLYPTGFDTPMQVQGIYYTPTTAEQAAVYAGAEPSGQYHADMQSFGVADRPFWVAKGLSAAGLGAPVPFGDMELASGVIGGAVQLTLGDLVYAGGSGIQGFGGVQLEFDMGMIPDFSLAYVHEFDEDYPHYNPEGFEYVGWSPGLWWEYKTWAYWELYWAVMLRPEEGPDFSAHSIPAAASYLNAMSYREDLIGQVPTYSGGFEAPTKAGLEQVLGEWVDDIVSITLQMRVEAWRDDGPESVIRYRGCIPCGPGVIEDWAQRYWTVSWNAKRDPDKMPPWPYSDEPNKASPAPSGRIRRSRARLGLLA